MSRSLTSQALIAEYWEIKDALVRRQGNMAAAAADLRIPLRTLWRRVREHEIDLGTIRHHRKPDT